MLYYHAVTTLFLDTNIDTVRNKIKYTAIKMAYELAGAEMNKFAVLRQNMVSGTCTLQKLHVNQVGKGGEIWQRL